MEKKFDFKPFDKVLVRNHESNNWRVDLFGVYQREKNCPYLCVGDAYLYCIPYEGNEHLLGTTDSYVEPYEPKDGDFVLIKTDGYSIVTWIAILECIDEEKDEVTTYASMSENDEDDLSWGIETLCDAKDIVSIRPATEEEKRLLISKLHEIGKDWDESKKEIVEYRWRPNFKGRYWSLEFDNEEWEFKAVLFRWYNGKISKIHLDENIVFKYKDDAEKEAERRNELLKGGKE